MKRKPGIKLGAYLRLKLRLKISKHPHGSISIKSWDKRLFVKNHNGTYQLILSTTKQKNRITPNFIGIYTKNLVRALRSLIN
jgi:hypothetical protein